MSKLGEVCKHGSLKRQCYTCELEERIAKLEAENKALTERAVKLEAVAEAARKIVAVNCEGNEDDHGKCEDLMASIARSALAALDADGGTK